VGGVGPADVDRRAGLRDRHLGGLVIAVVVAVAGVVGLDRVGAGRGRGAAARRRVGGDRQPAVVVGEAGGAGRGVAGDARERRRGRVAGGVVGGVGPADVDRRAGLRDRHLGGLVIAVVVAVAGVVGLDRVGAGRGRGAAARRRVGGDRQPAV